MGKLAKDSIVVSIIILAGFVIGTITNMFIFPKICSKSDLGIFRYVLNWGTLFAQFCTLGIGSAIARLHYRDNNRQRLSELSSMTVLVPLGGFLLFAIIFVLSSDWFIAVTTTENSFDAEPWLVVVSMLIFTFSITFTKTYTTVGTILKKSPPIFFITELLLRLMLLAVFILYYYNLLDFNFFMISLGVAHFVQMLLVIFVIRGYLFSSPLVIPSRKVFTPTFKLSLFGLIDNGTNLLVAQIDLIMIGALSANSFVRIQEYSMAMAIAVIVFLPWRSMISTTGPFIAEAFSRNDMESISNIYKKSSLNLFLVGSALFILIYANIDNLIQLIPDDYSIIKYPVLFLCIGRLIDMLASVNNSIIVLSPHYRYNLYFSLILLVIIIATNWILIPMMGITGSAIATAFCILVFNALKAWLVYKKFNLAPFHPNTLNVLLGMGAIFTFALLLPDIFHKNIFLNIVARGSIIAVVIYAYIALLKPSEDIERIRAKLVRRFVPGMRKK